MARLVKELTGPNETGRWGASATDLGFPAITNHGYTITIFGDTFVDHVGGSGWRSPVGFRQSNPDIENGIRWDNAIGGAYAKEMINYQHRGTVHAGELPDGFTNIPNDLIHLPDGRYMMTTFAIRSWDPISPGGSWATFHSRMWTSTEAHAENWERTWDLEVNRENFDFPNVGEWSHFQNNTMLMLPGEPWVYIYGTNEGRWNGGGIHLVRVDWRSMWNRSTYEFWGRDGGGTWAWRRGGFTTPILTPTVPNNAIGELSAQVIDGRVVLSYCDGILGAVTRTATRPEGLWTMPAIQVTGVEQPALYAPAIHPYSNLGRAQMLLSAWPQVNGQTLYYGTRQWEVSLFGGGSGSLSSSPTARAATENLSSESSHVTEEYTGDLAPDVSQLPVAEQVAVLADAVDAEVDHDWLRSALQGELEDDRTTPADHENYDPMTAE